MFKLDYHTWIRFGVWMAIGFVLYFGYGMWNSSEEYVRQGKIPPGGTAPLPVTAQNADEEPKPINGNAMRLRAIPITSLDDDGEFVKERAVPIPPEEVKVNPFPDELINVTSDALVGNSSPGNSEMNQAVLATHLAAVKVFEDSRKMREIQAHRAFIIETHQRAEQVFLKLRADKETERLMMQEQMAQMAQQARQLHEQLDKLFKEMEKEDPERSAAPPVARVRSMRLKPPGPMNAVMQELMSKATTIDADDEEANNLPAIIEPPATPPTASKTSKTTSEEQSSSALMLDELKKAFSQKNSKTPSENGDDDSTPQVQEDANISPRFVQALSAETAGKDAVNE